MNEHVAAHDHPVLDANQMRSEMMKRNKNAAKAPTLGHKSSAERY